MKKTIAAMLVAACMADAAAANQAPTVSMSGPLGTTNFIARATVPLSATAADSDGTVSKVVFYHGATVIGTVTAAPYNFNWSNVLAGTYNVTAQATDNSGAVTTSAPIAVEVKANVLPAVALASPANNAVFIAPVSIPLSVVTADTDGRVAKVAYVRGSSMIDQSMAAPFNVVWNVTAPGTYVLKAQATDDKTGSTWSAPITVVVKANSVPTVTLTAPATGASYAAPGVIALTATAGDGDGTIAKVAFYNGTTLLGTDTAAPYAYSWTNVPAGTYSITARATDDKGGVTTSAAVAVVVSPNTPPAVSLVASPSAALAPATVSMTATATDSDGTIAKVDFYNGATLLKTVTQAPYAFTWDAVAVGDYTLTARATDNLGAQATSPESVVKVGSGSAKVYYIYSDQIGTAREITDAAGVKVWVAGTEAFGAVPPNENPAGKGTFKYGPRFAGQYFDGETGLHYNYYRDFDPQTGRYVQSDPIGLEGGINTYGYVEADPLSRTDLFGLMGSRGAAPSVPSQISTTIANKSQLVIGPVEVQYTVKPGGENLYVGLRSFGILYTNTTELQCKLGDMSGPTIKVSGGAGWGAGVNGSIGVSTGDGTNFGGAQVSGGIQGRSGGIWGLLRRHQGWGGHSRWGSDELHV